MIKGIDKGDILSSGAPPITKEGRGQVDARRTKLGMLSFCSIDAKHSYLLFLSCGFIVSLRLQGVERMWVMLLRIPRMAALEVVGLII